MKTTVEIRLEPVGHCLRVVRGTSLQTALAQHGVEFPCGGHGRCAACRVKVLRGDLAQTESHADMLSPAQLAEGWRLACRSEARSDVTLEIGQWGSIILADDTDFVFEPRTGLGIAVDVGTTTLVAQLVDFQSGRVLGVRSAINPQVVDGADVMTRIEAAVHGGKLDGLVDRLRRTVGGLVTELVAAAGDRQRAVERVVLAGNTLMHHFFCGLDPRPLSAWPFAVETGAAGHLRAGDLGWPIHGDTPVTFLPCLGGFVGSDVLCGVLAIGMHRRDTPCVLVDLGTNGEIVVGNRERMLCASTAAGPVFEGGGIGMGMRATTGAVHKVQAHDGRLRASVIGGGIARGICGSGLVDAVAAALELKWIDASGRLSNGPLAVSGPVVITQHDIRRLQLAKAAIAAGMRVLRRNFGDAAGAAMPLYLAGAFGNCVDPVSASRIGLFHAGTSAGVPAGVADGVAQIHAAGNSCQVAQIHSAGNTSLLGAKMALLDGERAGFEFDSIRARVEHVPLAGDPDFQRFYLDEMPFPARCHQA